MASPICSQISDEQKRLIESNRFDALSKVAAKQNQVPISEIFSKGTRVQEIETGLLGTANFLERDENAGSILLVCKDVFGNLLRGNPVIGVSFYCLSELQYLDGCKSLPKHLPQNTVQSLDLEWLTPQPSSQCSATSQPSHLVSGNASQKPRGTYDSPSQRVVSPFFATPTRLGTVLTTPPTKQLGGGSQSKIDVWVNAGKSSNPTEIEASKRLTASSRLGSGERNSGEQTVSENGTNDLYWWLRDDAIRDAEGHRKNESRYNPGTCLVPHEAERLFTNVVAQYWLVKRDNFDVVIFFKIGKFYELYENDAVIGHQVLGLNYTSQSGKGSKMMCVGVPETSFSDAASKLVAKGYKVGCMEEMQHASEREKKKGAIIHRKLRRIFTPGTLTEQTMMGNWSSSQLMAVSPNDSNSDWGLCIIDLALRKFKIGRLQCDETLSGLSTLCLHELPNEIIYASSVPPATRTRLAAFLPNSIVTVLSPSQAWSATKVRMELKNFEYFSTLEEVPTKLREYWEDELVLEALGACLSYIKRLQFDNDVVTSATFSTLQPPLSKTSPFLVMDATMLRSLDIFECSASSVLARPAQSSPTLLSYLDRCVTPFGKRKLRWWIGHPLRNGSDIRERQTALRDLGSIPDAVAIAATKLKAVGDVERTLARVHTHASRISGNYVLNDEEELDRRVLKDVASAVEGMSNLLSATEVLLPHLASFDSTLLINTVTLRDRACLGFLSYSDPEQRESVLTHGILERLDPVLKNLKQGYKIDDNGSLSVREEFCDDVKGALSELNEIERKLEMYIERLKVENGFSMRYCSSGREPYLIEVPAYCVAKVPGSFMIQSSTKSFSRYMTPTLSSLVSQWNEAKETLRESKRVVLHRLCVQLDKQYLLFQHCINNAAQLDILFSLLLVSNGPNMNWPTILDASQESEGRPKLEIKNLKHPYAIYSDTFIPLSINIGGSLSQPLIILTGPNMGGKSTTLRLTCLAIVIAQLGIALPCDSCVLSPCDRIFARLGARDDIMQGVSTFLAEMQETGVMLREATEFSFLIIDELGRGTSTFDGHAIAHAVVGHLASIGSRTLFATHYHSLCSEYARHPRVASCHMACIVNEYDRSLVFLYQLVSGVCPQSFGTHCARIAGISESIVDRAALVSAEFERNGKRRRLSSGVSAPKRLVIKSPGTAAESPTEPVRMTLQDLQHFKLIMNASPDLHPNTRSLVSTYQKFLSIWLERLDTNTM